MLEAILTANIEEIKISGLTQWDRGQMLRIICPDLPASFQVHFTNRAREKAIPVQAVGANNAATVTIPNEILCEPYEVLAHIYFTEGDAGRIGETVKTIRMPITPRAQPEDYIVDLTPEQQTEAEILIEKMMDEHATAAANAATAGALASIKDALSKLPAGSTLVINDLTTGGASAALSAEMGKVLGQTTLPRDGSAAMTNALEIRIPGNSVTNITSDPTGARLSSYNEWGNGRAIRIPSESAPVGWDQLSYIDDTGMHTILHTGNKPSGSYTGNGDAAKRTINIGGIGDAVLIMAQSGKVALVTWAGMIYADGTSASQFYPSSVASYSGGTLLMSTNSSINAGNTTYYYQVL